MIKIEEIRNFLGTELEWHFDIFGWIEKDLAIEKK